VSTDGLTEEGELRYKAWGETRYSSGTTPTKRQFTGQISDSYINLYWYGSRWYDDALGRFIQPDPIIPEPYNSLAYDRYQYVYSNPVRYTDPSGHCIWDLCILEGIGLVELALIFGGSAVALYAATPDAREAATEAITEGLDWLSEQATEGLRNFAKLTEPKPLLPDEQVHVGRATDEIDHWLATHPDVASEAERVRQGESLPQQSHVREAWDKVRELERTIRTLQGISRKNRTLDALRQIDYALKNSREKLKYLKDILKDTERVDKNKKK